MRSVAREVVFKYIFSKLFNQDDEGLFGVLLINEKLSAEDKKFARDLLGFIEKDYEKYNCKLEELSVGFHPSRIFNADKCAIFIGMAEFDNFKDTPVPVIVDQAVNLSAKYSTEKSTDFVNGILAKYVKE